MVLESLFFKYKCVRSCYGFSADVNRAVTQLVQIMTSTVRYEGISTYRRVFKRKSCETYWGDL